MAFDGFQGQQSYSPSEYGFSFSNSESTIDKTNIQFSMWKTTLQIKISPLVETNGEFKIDRRNSVSAFLIPAKAHMFSDILKKFKEDPEKFNNYGVASGKALISVMNAKSYGKDKENGALINIRTITQEGTVESSYSYEIRKNNYNCVIGFDEKKSSFKQDFDSYNNVELDLIIKQLDAYVDAMTNAIAFTVNNSLYKYFDKISSKLGVDLVGNGYRSGGNQSYFSPNNAAGHAVGNTTQAPIPVSGGLSSLIGG